MIIQDAIIQQQLESPQERSSQKRYVYWIAGIAQLFGCSILTAQHVKSSGVLDGAISQTGKILVVDSEKAIGLLRISTKYEKRYRKK